MARVLECPRCGGPLPSRARIVVVVCPYCGATVSLDGEIVRAAEYRRARESEARETADDTRRVDVDGEPYLLGGHLASGASSEVFWAERARRCKERVVLKVLRVDEDAPLLAHEWGVLGALESSKARGAEHFTRLLPQRVAKGTVKRGAAERPASVFGLKSGFVHTLEDVKREYPHGVDATHVVWMWKRLLEIVGFVHESGVVHGAVLPEHVLLHARDHGAVLVGFSAADRIGAPASLMMRDRESFYPEGRSLTPARDLVMVARTVDFVAGATRLPDALAELLRGYTQPSPSLVTERALELHRLVSAAAERAFGPPKFVHFSMPGWHRAST